MSDADSRFMKAAIDIADRHQTPFGAVLVKGNEIVMCSANETRQLNDPTAHAELLAIRKLATDLKKTDLSGHKLYATCEPCSMCMSAAIWANIDELIYGCSIPEIVDHIDQITLRAHSLNSYSFRKIAVKGGILKNDCEQLFKQFS